MAEKLTQIELTGVQSTKAQPRRLHQGDFSFGDSTKSDDVETGCGLLHVLVQGDRGKPAIFTYHDIGLNSATCFEGFFSMPEMKPILQKFCVYHINAPGQQEGCLPLPQGIGHTGDATSIQGYVYPTMDQLAEMLLPVMQFYGVNQFIGFGVGAGANVLARFAIKYPDKVEALTLLNCTATKAGWMEWGYQKINSWYLRSGQITTGVEEYLLWHWFGDVTMAKNNDLVLTYSNYIKAINPTNLAHFIEAYIKRTDLGVSRETDPVRKLSAKTIKCPTMLVGGDHSPHLNDTVNMNSRLDPSTCQWMKFECGGMIQEETPMKLCEAFCLFLQGIGYVSNVSTFKMHSVGASASATPVGATQAPAQPRLSVC